jgi:(S)-ureidoglycine-glyoxylate aminotransferase
MGYNARRDAVLTTVGALEAVLAGEHHRFSRGAGIDAARAVYNDAQVTAP